MLFEGKTGDHLPLTRVYFILRLTTNIISLNQLNEGGCNVHAKHGVPWICDDKERLVARVKCSANQLYLLHVKIGWPLCVATHVSDSAWLWHKHCRHLNFDARCKLEQQGMVHVLPHVEHVHHLYAYCITTKPKKSPFPS